MVNWKLLGSISLSVLGLVLIVNGAINLYLTVIISNFSDYLGMPLMIVGFVFMVAGAYLTIMINSKSLKQSK
jgi:hypothetical protein